MKAERRRAHSVPGPMVCGSREGSRAWTETGEPQTDWGGSPEREDEGRARRGCGGHPCSPSGRHPQLLPVRAPWPSLRDTTPPRSVHAACPPHPTPTREAPSETWPTPASRLAGRSAEIRMNGLGHKPGQPEALSLNSRTSGASVTEKEAGRVRLDRPGNATGRGLLAAASNHRGAGRVAGSRRRSRR